MSIVFQPASKKQELMLKRASDTQVVVIGGAAGCVDEETEFLSESGWKSIADYQEGDKVLQIDPKTHKGSFVEPVRYIKVKADMFYHITSPRGLNQMLSPEHKNLMYSARGESKVMSMQELYDHHENSKTGSKLSFATTYSYEDGFSTGLSEDQLRFAVAIKADGSLVNPATNRWRVRLLKERKVIRFDDLVSRLGLKVKRQIEDATGFTIYDFHLPSDFKCTKLFSDWMLCCKKDASVIADELKYWDGYFACEGNRIPSVTTVSKQCADAIQYFFNMEGFRTSIRADGREGQTYLTHGKEYIRKCDCYKITPTTQVKLNLQRKANKKLVIEKVYDKEFKYCFEVDTGFFLIRRGGDIVITGNSGKSHILNNLPLLVADDPNSNCVMYRRTNPQLEGGFYPNGRAIWTNLPDDVPEWLKPKNIREQKKEIILNGGCKIKYQQAENTAKARDDAQGQEFTLVTVDEATQHDWVFLEYLMSRLRSNSKHFSRMVLSCNPSSDHYIRNLIDWYLTEDGYSDPEKDGVVRYFVADNGGFVWGSSQQELADKFNIPEDMWEKKIISFSYVSGTIYDNPYMMKNSPSYLAFLEGLNEVDKSQLLFGNWNAVLKGANYFERGWCKEIQSHQMPPDVTCCRAYDLAATERSQAVKWPDPTACGKMYRDRQGYYYLAGEYHPDFYDDVLGIQGQFCKRAGDRDNHIIKQAQTDGADCLIILPVDVGAAGKSNYMSMASNIAQYGFSVKQDPMPVNKSKLSRFLPLASACENGLVYVLVDTFDKKTLEYIYKQLEAFTGERSTTERKDDFADLFATAFNFISVKKVHKPFTLPSIDAPTRLSAHRSTTR